MTPTPGSLTSPYSFRDPDAVLFHQGDRLVRRVRQPLGTELLRFLQSPLAEKLVAEGRLIATNPIQDRAANAGAPEYVLLEHETVPFPSYCCEWPLGMWMEAGELTLSLARDLLGEGYELKDATPDNILFVGSRAVFVDIASIVPRLPCRTIWPAYAQFVRTFVLPVIAHKALGWPLLLTLHYRDGYDPEQLYAAMHPLMRLRRGIFSSVTLPVWLQRLARNPDHGNLLKSHAADESSGREVLRRTIYNLRRAFLGAEPRPHSGRWSQYVHEAKHYDAEAQRQKLNFVESALLRTVPATVLDVGANTGVFSRLAARTGARVVALERDPGSADENYRQSRQERLNVLSLVVDLARPTPAAGWNNGESTSFLQRAENHFDLVLMLAVVHHLLLSDQIPLPFIADLLARLTRRHVLIEWIPTTDPKFRELVRGRDAIYDHLTEEYARMVFGGCFRYIAEHKLDNGRLLWLLEKQ